MTDVASIPVELLGERFHIRTDLNQGEVEEALQYAQDILEKFVQNKSSENRRHILLAVLFLCQEVLALRKDKELLKFELENWQNRLKDLSESFENIDL